MAAITVGSQVTSANSWSRSLAYGYVPTAAYPVMASNGKIFVSVTYHDGESGDTYTYSLYQGTWNGTFSLWRTSSYTPQYGMAEPVELGGYVYYPVYSYPNYMIGKIDSNAMTYTEIAYPSVASASPVGGQLFVNPTDNKLYHVILTNSGGTITINRFDGSSWTQTLSTTLGVAGSYYYHYMMDSSGTIHIYFIITGGSTGTVYYKTITNNGTVGNAPILIGSTYTTYNGFVKHSNGSVGYSPIVGASYRASSTGARVFTYVANTAPNAPTVTSPTAYANTRTPTISWTFSDPDSGDTQAGFAVSIVNSSYTVQLWDSGYIAGAATSYTIPAGVITADGNYYFRVKVWDASGTVNIANGAGPDPNFGGRSTPTLIDTVIPNQPTHTIGTVTGTTAAITFSAFSDPVPSSGQAGGAYVCVDNAAGNTRIQTTQMAVGQTSYTITGLTANTQYRVYVVYQDNAGNWGIPSAASTVTTDTLAPNAPTQTNGVVYATSNGVSWSAFNDPAPSSGLLLTTLYLQQWNGSSWINVSGYPKSVVGLTNNMTGLTPATQYRWGVTYTDNAGNVSTLNYTTFTTNSYSVSTSVNLSALGYTLNKRPKFKFTVTDANDATLTNFQIQVSAVNDFSSTLIDTTSSAVSAGWSATSLPSGSIGYYTPQADLSTGTRYVRIRAYDGKDWGTWSATAAFTIQAVSWPTVIVADDTAISKRTIDDLRTKVNAIRQARGLAAAAWTDTSIQDWTNGASATNVRAVHLIELRQAITDIYTVLSTAAPSWAPDTVIDTTKNRKGQHWLDLRTALLGT
ncbi:fibronectin type III domain-containing protein [Paenibacillus whitsoniae]|uniref:Fibronectin type III domain-containing protein n=1 Tax=Paenibacillus whitsoniae TaxID=2496558 RepID=A0A430JE57_9BACL|nr:fibronectin type III domain-containing protein [Paenibacillus whitsoniae]RTE09296.1 fibronectin type III domain-containing protein [Paenibacillus whitsoniae]